jgi:hypothetical protein
VKRRGAMRIALVSATAAAFAVTGAACSSGYHYDSVYCVDAQGRVVDDWYCDEANPYGGSRYGYYYWHRPGRYSYSMGSYVSGGTRIRTDDYSGRVAAGLAGSGRVSSGTISRGGIGGGSRLSSGS